MTKQNNFSSVLRSHLPGPTLLETYIAFPVDFYAKPSPGVLQSRLEAGNRNLQAKSDVELGSTQERCTGDFDQELSVVDKFHPSDRVLLDLLLP